MTGGNFNLNNSSAIQLSGSFLANNFRLAAPSVVLNAATSIAPNQNDGGSLIWVNNGANWSFAGNDYALNLGTAKAAFRAISFSGSLSSIGSAKIYALSPLNWPNGATLQSGGNIYDAPRNSITLGTIFVSVAIPVKIPQAQETPQAQEQPPSPTAATGLNTLEIQRDAHRDQHDRVNTDTARHRGKYHRNNIQC